MSTDRRDAALQWSIAGVLAACLLTLETLGGPAGGSLRPDVPADPPPGAVLLGHGTERLPSESAADWVRSAEYVVEVRVVAERAQPVPAIDRQRGEGIILRDLDLEVSSVVWSAPGTGMAPKTLGWRAFGWHWKGDPDQRRELGVRGAPRMEVGHTYLLALDRPLAECGDAVTVVQASETEWLGLGGSSVVPFDGGHVGDGEFEGIDNGLMGPAGSEGSVLARTLGEGLPEVRDLLRKAARTTPPGPASRSCA
jgi:hypothetical protein